MSQFKKLTDDILNEGVVDWDDRSAEDGDTATYQTRIANHALPDAYAHDVEQFMHQAWTRGFRSWFSIEIDNDRLVVSMSKSKYHEPVDGYASKLDTGIEHAIRDMREYLEDTSSEMWAEMSPAGRRAYNDANGNYPDPD